MSTVGASFQTKRVVDDESDTVVRLQIWDTAGQERFRYSQLLFSLLLPSLISRGKKTLGVYDRQTKYKTNANNPNRSISRLYYRGANACILCYSITDLSSFEEMGIWLLELRRNLPPDIILHVVGTKADLVARDPSLRQVPFERCIAYVAENLAPGMSSTPPATAGALDSSIASGGGLRGFLNGGIGMGGGGYHADGGGGGGGGGRSPSSKRSSGFWGQEVGWDCCHEVSAESGEGVEEVFRVITRKLVEQNRKTQEALASAVMSPGYTPSVEGGEAYFDGVRPGGSFRVGRDRRSWFGVPVETYIEGGAGEGQNDQQVKQTRKCC